METYNLRESLIQTKDPFETQYLPFLDWEYDYEINNLTSEIFSAENSLKSKRNSILNNYNLNEFNDEFADAQYKCEEITCFKKNFIKKLVSKKKISYVTKRVMAMGFPASNCEALYRNNISDVKRLFKVYHNDKIKIYNLCLEKERIYNKEKFAENEVAIFPFSDHCACPIRLMLEFCVDLVLFLSKNPKNSAAVHCKAGKGRTGVMICSYLIFSGLSQNNSQAYKDYAERKSYAKKGVTIPSQKRYIHHFETYLSCNFQKPYIKMIPKICKYYLKPHRNILINIFKDKNFREFKNKFKLHKIKIGPFSERNYLNFIIEDCKKQIKFNSGSKFEKVNFKYAIKEEIESSRNVFYSILEFNEPFILNEDINVKISSKKINFNSWLNLFFITLEYYFFVINEFLENDIISNSVNYSKNEIGNLPLFQNSGKKPSNEYSNKNIKEIQMNDMSNIRTNLLANKLHSAGKNDFQQRRRGNNLSIGFGLLNKTNINVNTTKNPNLTPIETLSKIKTDPKEENYFENFNLNRENLIQSFSKENNKEKEGLKNKEELKEIENKLNKIYGTTYDCNYYWKNDLILDNEKIKNFLQENTNFIEENIDLNNIYKYFFGIHSEYFENKKKKFKIKLNSTGLDKFSLKKKVLKEFSMTIKYSLCD